MTAFALLVLFVVKCNGIPLPSAFYTPSPNPDNPDAGNMLSSDASKDISLFQSKLLNDPPTYVRTSKVFA